MKLRKLLAAIAAAAVTVSAMALNAFAADIWTGSNDVGTDWNGDNALKIDSSSFANTNGGDTVEIAYTTNEDSGMCLKVVENTNGWPTLNSPEGMDPQWSTISVDKGSTSYSFVISADDVTRIQTNGMVIQGVGVTITKVAVTSAAADDTATAAADEATDDKTDAEADSEDIADDADADIVDTDDDDAADTDTAADNSASADTAADNAAPAADTTTAAAATGNVAVASIAAVMAVAGAAAIVSKKRK